jgi:hypothetical protein
MTPRGEHFLTAETRRAAAPAPFGPIFNRSWFSLQAVRSAGCVESSFAYFVATIWSGARPRSTHCSSVAKASKKFGARPAVTVIHAGNHEQSRIALASLVEMQYGEDHDQLSALGPIRGAGNERRSSRAPSTSAFRGLSSSRAAATQRPYDPKQRLPRYYALIRSSSRPTKRNNRTTRTALATILIHLNQPWKISATSPPSR